MKHYSGVVVPLITPFLKSGQPDLPALEKLVTYVGKHHGHPMVLGTTGEAASMSETQKTSVVRSLGRFRGILTLYAGISGNCREDLADRSKQYADCGMDVLVAQLPSYYLLSPRAMTQWFESLAEESPLPVMIYNIPATTHMSIPLEVIDYLSHHEKIVGLKDSERSEERLSASITLWKDRQDFSHFTGWAARSFSALVAGSDGIIPSSANLMPQVYEILHQAAQKRDTETGLAMQRLSDELGSLYQQGRLLGESLAALKVLAGTLDLCEPFTLPPVYPLQAVEQQRLQQEFHAYYFTHTPLLNTLKDDDRQ